MIISPRPASRGPGTTRQIRPGNCHCLKFISPGVLCNILPKFPVKYGDIPLIQKPRMIRLKQILLLFLFLSTGLSGMAQKNVAVLKLHDEINPTSSRFVLRGLRDAEEMKADAIIIHMNTYGGTLLDADTIRSAVLRCKLPTAVFVDPNAGSAGALISLACDSIYMSRGATIGAATVVTQYGDAAPDKYQSYMRGLMRSTAIENGRDPRIAEKMVDEKLDLPDISPMGQVITFTADEAMTYGYCDGIVGSVEEAASAMGFDGAKITTIEPSFSEEAVGFLNTPWISTLLIWLIFAGIFMEIKTPGVGLAGGVAVMAMALFFAPHYIEGLAASWEIIAFLVGVVLIGLEIFVIPGFGVAGILGLLLVVGSATFAMIPSPGPGMPGVPVNTILKNAAMVMVSLATAVIVVIWVAKTLFSTRTPYPYVDTMVQSKEEGYTAANPKLLDVIGKQGEAVTDMRPSGFVIIEGEKLDAEALKGFIMKGDLVEAVKVTGITVIVKKV